MIAPMIQSHFIPNRARRMSMIGVLIAMALSTQGCLAMAAGGVVVGAAGAVVGTAGAVTVGAAKLGGHVVASGVRAATGSGHDRRGDDDHPRR